MKQQLTADRLKEVCSYEPITGEFTRRGRVVRSKTRTGYLRMVIDGREYMQHRLAWLYTYGAWPHGDIDHINGVPTDNRIANLRDCSHGVNAENRRGPQSNNLLGLHGVTRRRNGFEARIRVQKKLIYLGLFDTPDEAHIAFLDAKRRLHLGCTI